MEAENRHQAFTGKQRKVYSIAFVSHCYAAVAYARRLRKRCRRHCWQAIVPSDKAASLKYFEQKNFNGFTLPLVQSKKQVWGSFLAVWCTAPAYGNCNYCSFVGFLCK